MPGDVSMNEKWQQRFGSFLLKNGRYIYFLGTDGGRWARSVITHNGSRSSSCPVWSCHSTLVHLKETGKWSRILLTWSEKIKISICVGTYPTSIWKPSPPEPCSSGPRRKGKGHRAPPCWPHSPHYSGVVLFRRTKTGAWKPDHATHQSKTFMKKYSAVFFFVFFFGALERNRIGTFWGGDFLLLVLTKWQLLFSQVRSCSNFWADGPCSWGR